MAKGSFLTLPDAKAFLPTRKGKETYSKRPLAEVPKTPKAFLPVIPKGGVFWPPREADSLPCLLGSGAGSEVAKLWRETQALACEVGLLQ